MTQAEIVMRSLRRRLDNEFYGGVISALHTMDQVPATDRAFRAVVETMDTSEIVRVARADGLMKWSGLARRGYGAAPKRPRNRAKAKRA
jgi:hypothetical protein